MSATKDVQIPLSNLDIENFLQCYNASYINYNELASHASMHDIFDASNFRIMHLPSDISDIGHWVVILRRTDSLFEYFDPMGMAPDASNVRLNRKPENKSKKYFRELIARTPGATFIFNAQPLQDPTSLVCGKFVIARVLSMKTQLKEYIDLLLSISTNLDEFMNKTITIPLVNRSN